MKNKDKQRQQLITVTLELAGQRKENKIRATKLVKANIKLAEQSDEKEKRAAELILANVELAFQKDEKDKRAAELVLANVELVFQNKEKEKRAVELLVANLELAFQHDEKEKRAAELVEFRNEDIAERNKDEEYIGHLAAIVESSDNAIISKSLDGIIKSWNMGSEKIFGYTATEAIGNHISLIIPKEYLVEEKIILEKIRNDEGIDNYETVRIRKSGERFHISLTVSPLKDRSGNIIGVSKIASDITARKKSEASLLRLNKELIFQNEEKEKRAAELLIANKELVFQNEEKEKRAAELIIANNELVLHNEEKERRAIELIMANKVLKQFAYVASHDLQEPLRTVCNYMQAFEEDYVDQLDDTAGKYLRSVENATKRMSMVIKSLLNFSRLGHNTKVATVNCKTLLDDVINDLETIIKDSKTTIVVTDMPILNVYETEIRQVFQNLITNAIKFRKAGTSPKIQIRSEQIDEKWKFSVRDNGIGIAPIHFERIFDIFQRLHTNEEYEGNGIGLANCKQIVQLHHGQIGVESSLGQGATFHFTIPNLVL